MFKMYSLSKEERDKMGKNGRKHVLENYNFEKVGKIWVEYMKKVHEECGSWESRINYDAYNIIKF